MHEKLIGLEVSKLKEMAPSATHQHYKGGLYQFIGEGIHTETEEELVFYRHVLPHEPTLYARPKAMFYEEGRFKKLSVPNIVDGS